MKIIHNFLAASVLILGMYTAQVSAEERQKDTNQTAAESKIQVLDQKIATIQLQIDKLEKKGIENLSDEEFIEHDELSDKLLVTMREKKEKMLKDQNIQIEELKAILE